MDKNSDWLAVSTTKIKADMKLREEAKKLKGKPKKPKAAKDSDLSEPAKAGSEKWGNTQSATTPKPGENGNAVINPTPPAKAKKLEIHNSDAGTASTVWMERFYVEMCKPMPTKESFHPRAFKLAELVLKCTQEEPFHIEGRDWARKPRAWYAAQLGVTERQVQRLVAVAPLMSATKIVNGNPAYCLRVAPKTDMTFEDSARIMAQAWKEHTKNVENETARNVSKQQFGLLTGLAKAWGTYFAPDVFLTILNNWASFNANVSIHIDLAKKYGDSFNSNKYTFIKRFYKFPSINVIARFPDAGWETFELKMQMQYHGKCSSLKIHPKALKKLNIF